MSIGDRIKARRIELGLTQADLARALGYKSKTTITKIEAGKNDIQQSKVVAFAKALNTTPAYLMGWTDDPDEHDEHAEQMERVAQWREKNPLPAEEKHYTLDDVYLNFAKEAQADGIDPKDIRAVLDILKRTRNHD